MKNDVSKAIAKRIREIIDSKALKYCAVAKACGYSPTKICDLLNGRAIIKPEDIVVFSNYLKVTPNELYGISSYTA